MMKNLIFDLKSEGSTYSRVNTVVLSATCVIFFGVFVEWQFCRLVQTNLTIIILSCTEILLMSLICLSVNSPSFTVLDITTQP